jgi:hypothetical protein
LLITALLSAINGCIGLAFAGNTLAFAEVAISYAAWSILVGMPVIILLTSIFAIIPECPEKCHSQPDIDVTIGNNMQEIVVANNMPEAIRLTKEADHHQHAGRGAPTDHRAYT